jgi:hypothetical protein
MRCTFVQVPRLSNIIGVAAGGYHSLAVRRDGTVWTCGANAHGQLGLADADSRPNFIQVAGLSNVIAVAGAGYHSLAVSGIKLTVQSLPPKGVVINSSTGHGGTTDYTVMRPVGGTTVALTAPDADPVGYVFSKWKVAGVSQPAGQRTVSFALDTATTALASYAAINLAVQSTPPTGVVIGSSTGHGGTTNYSLQALASGTSVALTVPGADPAGYYFYQWKIAGAAQPVGQRTIGFTITAPTTVLAVYRSGTTTSTSTTTTTMP